MLADCSSAPTDCVLFVGPEETSRRLPWPASSEKLRPMGWFGTPDLDRNLAVDDVGVSLGRAGMGCGLGLTVGGLVVGAIGVAALLSCPGLAGGESRAPLCFLGDWRLVRVVVGGVGLGWGLGSVCCTEPRPSARVTATFMSSLLSVFLSAASRLLRCFACLCALLAPACSVLISVTTLTCDCLELNCRTAACRVATPTTAA
mmetsp:Transcript_27761/g.43344  ORF Transcript_27761/g.43344 Transcript_27761/m.43344 type:complete len:202 (-) Transcript_27761:1279-1884(-)